VTEAETSKDNSTKGLSRLTVEEVKRVFDDTSRYAVGLRLLEFEAVIKKLLSLGSGRAAKLYAQRLFDAFDTDSNGSISLPELINGLCGLSDKGTISDKMKFAFAILDKDGNGTVSQAEARHFLRAMVPAGKGERGGERVRGGGGGKGASLSGSKSKSSLPGTRGEESLEEKLDEMVDEIFFQFAHDRGETCPNTCLAGAVKTLPALLNWLGSLTERYERLWQPRLNDQLPELSDLQGEGASNTKRSLESLSNESILRMIRGATQDKKANYGGKATLTVSLPSLIKDLSLAVNQDPTACASIGRVLSSLYQHKRGIASWAEVVCCLGIMCRTRDEERVNLIGNLWSGGGTSLDRDQIRHVLITLQGHESPLQKANKISVDDVRRLDGGFGIQGKQLTVEKIDMSLPFTGGNRPRTALQAPPGVKDQMTQMPKAPYNGGHIQDPLMALLGKGTELLEAMDTAIGGGSPTGVPFQPLAKTAIEKDLWSAPGATGRRHVDEIGTELLMNYTPPGQSSYATRAMQGGSATGASGWSGRDLLDPRLEAQIADQARRLEGMSVTIGSLDLTDDLVPLFGPQPTFTLEYSFLADEYGIGGVMRGHSTTTIQSNKLARAVVTFDHWTAYPLNFRAGTHNISGTETFGAWRKGCMAVKIFASGTGREPELFALAHIPLNGILLASQFCYRQKVQLRASPGGVIEVMEASRAGKKGFIPGEWAPRLDISVHLTASLEDRQGQIPYQTAVPGTQTGQGAAGLMGAMAGGGALQQPAQQFYPPQPPHPPIGQPVPPPLLEAQGGPYPTMPTYHHSIQQQQQGTISHANPSSNPYPLMNPTMDMPGLRQNSGGLSMYLSFTELGGLRCGTSGGRSCFFALLKVGPSVPETRSQSMPWQAGSCALALQSCVQIPTDNSFIKHLRDNYAAVEVFEEVQSYPPTTKFYGLVKIPLKLVWESYMRMCNNGSTFGAQDPRGDVICDSKLSISDPISGDLKGSMRCTLQLGPTATMERLLLFAANTVDPNLKPLGHRDANWKDKRPKFDQKSMKLLVDKIFEKAALIKGKLSPKSFLAHAMGDVQLLDWIERHSMSLKTMLDEPDKLPQQQGIQNKGQISSLFTKLSTHRLLSLFKAESHANKITLADFDKICPQLFGDSKTESRRFGQRLFDAIDVDNNGKLDWLEFATALGALCHGSQEERIDLAFRMADKNHDGLVSKSELLRFLKMLTTQGLDKKKDSRNKSAAELLAEGYKPANIYNPITMIPQLRSEGTKLPTSPFGGAGGYTGDCKVTVRLLDLQAKGEVPTSAAQEGFEQGSLLSMLLHPDVEAVFLSFRFHNMQPSRTRPITNYFDNRAVRIGHSETYYIGNGAPFAQYMSAGTLPVLLWVIERGTLQERQVGQGRVRLKELFPNCDKKSDVIQVSTRCCIQQEGEPEHSREGIDCSLHISVEYPKPLPDSDRPNMVRTTMAHPPANNHGVTYGGAPPNVYGGTSKMGYTGSSALPQPYMAAPQSAMMASVGGAVPPPPGNGPALPYGGSWPQLPMLVQVFQEEGWQGQLNYDDFDRAIRRLLDIPTGQEGIGMVQHLFRLFDTNNNAAIDWREFAFGLSVMCEGTPEEKLAAIFRILDRDSSGRLSRQELHEFFASIAEPPVDMGAISRVSESMMSEADHARVGSLSLEDLIRWEGSREILGWLMSFTSRFRLGSGGHTGTSPARGAVMTMSRGVQGLQLSLLVKVFEEEGWRGQLNLADFDRALRRLLDLRPGQEGDGMVHHLFRLFDQNQNGSIDWREFVFGMSVLCDGSAVEKLKAIFDMLDRDKSGRLSRQELLEFFGSISERPVDMGKVRRVTERMMIEADRERCGSLSFGDLMGWSGNKEILGWLEAFATRLRAGYAVAPTERTPSFDRALSLIGPLSSLGSIEPAFAEELLRAFHAESPNVNPLTYEQLQKVTQKLRVTDKTTAQGKAMVGHLFRLFDSHQSGSVHWREFLHGMSLLCHGSAQEKMKAIFGMIDRSRSGFVTRLELLEFFRSISEEPVDNQRVTRVVDRILREADKEGRGQVGLKDLLLWGGSCEMVGWLETVTAHLREMTGTFVPPGPVWKDAPDKGGASIWGEVHCLDAARLCNLVWNEKEGHAGAPSPSVSLAKLEALLQKMLYLEVRVTAREFATRLFEIFHPHKGKASRVVLGLGLIAACSGSWTEKLLALYKLMDRGGKGSCSYGDFKTFLEDCRNPRVFEPPLQGFLHESSPEKASYMLFDEFYAWIHSNTLLEEWLRHHSVVLGEGVASLTRKYTNVLDGPLNKPGAAKALNKHKHVPSTQGCTIQIDSAVNLTLHHPRSKSVPGKGFLYVVCHKPRLCTKKIEFKSNQLSQPNWKFEKKLQPHAIDWSKPKVEIEFELRLAKSGEPKGVCTLASVLEDPGVLDQQHDSLLEALEYAGRSDPDDRCIGTVVVDISSLRHGMHEVCGWYHVVDGAETVGQIKIRAAPADRPRMEAPDACAKAATNESSPVKAPNENYGAFSAVHNSVKNLSNATSSLLLPPTASAGLPEGRPGVPVAPFPFAGLSNDGFVSIFQSNTWVGRVTFGEFTYALEKLVPATVEKGSPALLGRLFWAFQEDGVVAWRGFLLGMGVLSRGTPEERLRLAFQMMDRTRTGRVSRSELVEFLCAVWDRPLDIHAMERLADRLLLDQDSTGRGAISMQELLAWHNSAAITNAMAGYVARVKPILEQAVPHQASVTTLHAETVPSKYGHTGTGIDVEGSRPDSGPVEFSAVGVMECERALCGEAPGCGLLTYMEFDRVIRRLLSLEDGLEGSLFVERIFKLFDADGRGAVDWGVFICGLLHLVAGTGQEKVGCVVSLLARGSGSVYESTLEAFLRATAAGDEGGGGRYLDDVKDKLIARGGGSIMVTELLSTENREVLGRWIASFNCRFEQNVRGASADAARRVPPPQPMATQAYLV